MVKRTVTMEQAQTERRGWTKAHGSQTQARLNNLLAIIYSLYEDNKSGPILEFGVGSGFSLANMAALAQELEMPNMFYGFDSFQGLPHDEEIESRPGHAWRKGWFAYPIEMAEKAIDGLDKVKLISGFYDKSLTAERFTELGLAGVTAALIHVDSDLYSSAVTVLEWTRPLIQVGTLIAFDEWGGGEERAWAEFVKEHNILFEEAFKTGEQLIVRIING